MKSGLALAIALLVAPIARADETLTVGPGQTLSFHVSPSRDAPVASRIYRIELTAGDWLVLVAPSTMINFRQDEPLIAVDGPAGRLIESYGWFPVKVTHSGAHRITVTKFHALQVSRYPAGHPVIDTGLREDDVRIEPMPLDQHAHISFEEMHPYTQDSPAAGGSPARMVIEVGRMTIHVYRADGIKQAGLWPYADAAIGPLLRSNRPIEPDSPLPWFPFSFGFVDFTAQAARLDAGCLSYLRAIEHRTQDASWPFGWVGYFTRGVSRDGRYFVTASADMALAATPGESGDGHGPVPEAYKAAVRRQLARDPEALSPRLALFDAVLTSLTLPCSAP